MSGTDPTPGGGPDDQPRADAGLPQYPAHGSRTPGVPDSATSRTTAATKAPHGVFLAVALAVVVGGLAFATGTMFGSAGGSDTPEAAVNELFESASDEDLIGVLESLPPGERDAVVEGVEGLADELERLELTSGLDLRSLSGFDLEIGDYTLRSTPINESLARVQVSGGTAAARSIPAELPIGERLRAILEDDLGVDLDGMEPEHSSEPMGEFELVTVRHGDGWYVSIGYTAAEAIRRSEGEPVPPFGTVAPVGGDSPEDAVRRLVEAGRTLDPRLAIGMLPPDEMAALYDYAPLFLERTEAAAARARERGEQLQVDQLEMHSEGSGDTRRVVLDALDVRIEISDGSSWRVTFDGDCFVSEERYVYRSGFGSIDEQGNLGGVGDEVERLEEETIRMCADGTVEVDGERVDDDHDGTPMRFSPVPTPWFEPSVVVVEQGGRWFVSPTRTALDLGLGSLRSLQPEDIDRLGDWLQSWIGHPVDRYPGEREEESGQGGYEPSTSTTIPPLPPTAVEDLPTPSTTEQQPLTTLPPVSTTEPSVPMSTATTPPPSSTSTPPSTTATTVEPGRAPGS